MDTNSESIVTLLNEGSESSTNPLPLTMSAELKAGDVKIAVLGTVPKEQDILQILGLAVNFLSKLKENLTLPHDSEWTISFAADQTYKLTSYSGRTIGPLNDMFKDTPIGAKSEELPTQLGIEFPKVG